ncbi:MAG: hypothetical protein MZW92_27305 [Comamonadaceae bacterium]|nr:hypothetical protein [Comamonadaceae bacterium]
MLRFAWFQPSVRRGRDSPPLLQVHREVMRTDLQLAAHVQAMRIDALHARVQRRMIAVNGCAPCAGDKAPIAAKRPLLHAAIRLVPAVGAARPGFATATSSPSRSDAN